MEAHYLAFLSLGFIFPRDSVSPPTPFTVLKGLWEVMSKSVDRLRGSLQERHLLVDIDRAIFTLANGLPRWLGDK